jgi:hypothetical protein
MCFKFSYKQLELFKKNEKKKNVDYVVKQLK